MKYVIVGNSAAAVAAVEGIRKNDKEGSITIISNEAYHTYSRPLISYLLLGKTTEQKMKYRDDNFYKDNDCNLMLSKQVTKINPADKSVTIDDGSVLCYDKLLITTGSVPFVPPAEGLNTVENVHTFMSLDDAKNLQKAITPKSKVLIVGAGLIGLKCAEGILNSVADITVVDLAPNILSSILDTEGSAIVKKHLEDKGITFKLAQSVSNYDKNKATLSSGETLDFDVLVMAVGVRPNVGLVKDAGGEVNRGIVVNDRMETSIPNVYAAGDCSEGYDVTIGGKRILALLPNAYMQGECAGFNMAGVEKEYNKALPMNAIGFFGLHIITAGAYDGEVYCLKEENEFKKLFYKDNVLKGYILIGNVEKAGIYTNLIRERTPLDKIDFDLICQKPGLMAFSKEERSIKLGGVSQ